MADASANARFVRRNPNIPRVYVYPTPYWFTVAINKNIFFWDVTPSGQSGVNRLFGGQYHLHLHGRKNQLNKEPVRSQLAAFFLVPSSANSFSCEDVGDMFLRKVGWLSTDYKALYPQQVTLHNHRCENLNPFTALNKLEILASCITGVLTMWLIFFGPQFNITSLIFITCKFLTTVCKIWVWTFSYTSVQHPHTEKQLTLRTITYTEYFCLVRKADGG
jgi:hypothetical protein